MKRNYRLLFGPLAGAILAFGIVCLALLVPGYSHVHRTVSEIGEIGSSARVPFAIMLCCVAICILVFASAVRDLSVVAHHSQWASYLIAFMAVPAAGTGIFAYPHPLHNVFGLSELIGYQAPLVFALTWRRDPWAKTLVTLSWVLFLLIWTAIILNLSPLGANGMIWAYVKPVYGLVQRGLFASWFGWCAVLGLLLFQRTRGIGREEKASPAALHGTLMSERSGSLDDDPFRGRRPSSHERATGLPWDASYRDGPAPWDVGQPQPAIVQLASKGGFAGTVLDAGCGTGEHTLYLASLGLSVLGVDVAETALAMARAKATDRGIKVEFAAADALQLERLGRKFDTVLDVGLFHTFDRDERPIYVASLASVIENDGILYVLCFSDEGPETGPHPISQEELKAAFNPSAGWNVVAIEPDRVQTNFHDHGAPAWLATIKRIEA